MQPNAPGTWPATRKFGRFLIDLRLIVRGKSTLHGRTKNLGEGGMGATIAGDIPFGEFVELQFQVPDHPDPLLIRAEVRYRQGFQYGFKFVDATEDQIAIIRNAVRDLPAAP
jgi:PilZ domain